MPTELDMLFDGAERTLESAQANIDKMRDMVQSMRSEVSDVQRIAERDDREAHAGSEVDFDHK